jgi:hypothetical protein
MAANGEEYTMDMSATTLIDLLPDDIYEFVSNPTNDVRWRNGVTDAGLTSDPPLQIGSEGYATAGKQTSRWRVTAIAPGTSVDWELIGGPIAGTGGYRLEAVDGRTRFTLVADVAPKGLLRLLGPLFGRMGRRHNLADVEKLRSILESGA